MSNQRGRDARTGEFIPMREALRRPATTVIETIPRPAPVRKPSPPPMRRK